ncbi:hypothetical protein [Wukongibacter sp. M2B1]|uniref:hypothetical protein n=1 Tax=Wukongibacter sp. M2B1 TaxID=3088895 RepID=UPI003D79859E
MFWTNFILKPQMPVLDSLEEPQDKMDEAARKEIGEAFGKPITFKKPFHEILKKILQEENSAIVKHIPLFPTEIMINNRYIHTYKL